MEQETNVVMTQEQPTKAQEILASKPVEAVETPAVEGVEQVEKAPEQVAEETRIAKVVAQVKAKEKELTAKERKLADREAKTKGYENIKQMLADDPLAAIETLGIDKNKLYEKIIKSGTEPTVEEKLAKLEADLVEEKKQRAKEREELEAQRAERTIIEFKNKIKDYAESKKETELKVTYALGQTSAIYDVIEQNFVATGSVMTIEDAGKRVEEYFSEKGKKEYERLKAIYEPKVEQPTNDDDVALMAKTLTNKSTTIPSADSGKLLSAEESKRFLAKKYQNKLFT
jgi:hypothetical protein